LIVSPKPFDIKTDLPQVLSGGSLFLQKKITKAIDTTSFPWYNLIVIAYDYEITNLSRPAVLQPQKPGLDISP